MMARLDTSGLLAKFYRKVVPTRSAVAPVGLKVLVVEDSPLQQVLLALMLKQLGYTVSFASDGFEAISAIRQTRYDAILLDCQLPLMSGIQATKYIRDLSKLTKRNPTIIGISATASRTQCLEAGMDDFLPKPVSRAVLREALSRHACH
jgi:CheY-like chemotaxis protein